MAQAEDRAETSRAAGVHLHHNHHLPHHLLLSGEQEESSRGDEPGAPDEFDEEEQGERIWVREDKVFPSLQRYIAYRSCESCNRDVELLDMMILKHGKNPDNNNPPPAESGSTCSDHSDPRDITENVKIRLQQQQLQSNPQLLQTIASPPPPPGMNIDLVPRADRSPQQLVVRSPPSVVPPPPPPDQHVCCVFCGSETRFEHYNNHKIDQPRYRCIKCKQRFTNGGKLRNKRLKLCISNSQEPT